MRAFLRDEFNQYILVLLFLTLGTLSLDAPKDGKKLNSENRLYSSGERALNVNMGDSFLQLSPSTSVFAKMQNGRVSLSSLMGKLEINIPANRSVRFPVESKDLEFFAMEGARIEAEGFSGGLQVRNVAGDVVLKTHSGRMIPMRKLTFASLTNGRLEISRLRLPEILSPRLKERLFKAGAGGDVMMYFKTPLFSDARTEYVIYGWANAVVARGEFDGRILNLNLPVGEYKIAARTRRANEYSGWTVPRAFSVWSKPAPGAIATAF
jgi:hypothetical protein